MWPFKMRAEPEIKKEVETPDDALLMASLADDSMTRDKAMNVPTFAACVNKIAEAVSTIPFNLYRIDESGRLKEYKD